MIIVAISRNKQQRPQKVAALPKAPLRKALPQTLPKALPTTLSQQPQ
jgi:hypothetical protein